MKKNIILSLAFASAMTANAANTYMTSLTDEAAPLTDAAANAPAIEVELTGCVMDSLTHEGEPMATLRVWKMGETRDNSKTSAMGTTDVDGRFSLQLKQKGQYVLMISSIGRNAIIKPFSVEKGQKVIDLGTMLISESAEELQDVVIAIQKPLVKMEGDKIAYSVKDDPDAKTNTLMEMLRKVPMVTVDGEDNIQVNGSSNFQIFMNGKPSPMLSGNPKETLKAIPAEGIRHIEVLTNPGAKYDAEGVGGILNIVTDQQKGMEGYTASVTAQAGNRMNGGNAYVMVQKDKLTLSVNAHEGYMNTPKMEATTIRDQYADGQHMETRSEMSGGSNILFSTIDATYQIDPQNTVSASVNVMDMRGNNTSDIVTEFTGIGSAPSFSQTNDNHTNSTSINASVDYVHTYSDNPMHSLTAAYRVGTQPRENESETEYSLATMPAYSMTDRNNMIENTLQLDYVQPIGQTQTFEAGGKYVWRRSSSESDLMDYRHSNDIGALYTTYGVTLGKYTAKAGLRYEHTEQEVSYRKGNGEDFSLSYDNLVPNLTLSFAPTMTQNLSLGYNMRISRPGISVLNPYRNLQNVTSVSYGNPNLEVEKVHNVQLTYNYYSPKLMLNTTLRYSYQDNGIEQYSFMKDNVLYSTYDNIACRQSTSLSLFASCSLTPSTRLTLNSTTSYLDLSASQMGLDNYGWQETLMLNVQQNLPWDMKLSLMYMANTPSITLQGKSSGMNMHMIGLTKSCLNDRLTLSLNTVNPFHSTMKMSTTTEGKDYISTSESCVSMGTIMGSVSYRFGDMHLTQPMKRTTQMESDLLEVKDSNEQMNGVFMNQ